MESITIKRFGRPVRFDYNEQTDMYHYDGSENYAGYTLDELSSMDEDNSDEDGFFYVQETIGGWRQSAIFKGTYEECKKYFEDNCWSGSWAIVPEEDYDVDYLE